MSSTMKIYCKNIEEYVDIKGGESLLQLAEALSERLGGMSPICASVNNKTEPLQYQVFAPKQVEFLDRRSASGERVYIRSLCMMLYCAVRQELPDVRLRIEHSIAGGYYCRLLTPAIPTACQTQPKWPKSPGDSSAPCALCSNATWPLSGKND